ncbi:hypothetical protein [Bacillus sp. 2205SS5-2]|uniref:hypothetical protein n=1 Tax=Bacillus sp. 2205SS5-2 TaxID=3109031 RepID=UPI0030053E1B
MPENKAISKVIDWYEKQQFLQMQPQEKLIPLGARHLNQFNNHILPKIPEENTPTFSWDLSTSEIFLGISVTFYLFISLQGSLIGESFLNASPYFLRYNACMVFVAS